MRIRIEYCSEGGGDPKAIELYSNGEKRELTYEAMDEVLKADILETELMAITGLMDRLDLSREHIPYRLADAITLSYENSEGHVKSFWEEKGSQQFTALLEVWIVFEQLSRHYFTPRFY